MTGAAAKGAPTEERAAARGPEQGRARSLPLRDGRRLVLAATPRIVGIVNVTPDSFSDGGRWLAPERAVGHGLALLEQGADVLDLGAESTRPGGGVYGDGAATVGPSEELDRLLPVLEGLRRETKAPISVDSRKAAVARVALAAGADLVNDVSALGDDSMAAVVAEAGCPLILMHSRGELASMQRHIRYDDVVAEVCADLEDKAERAVAAGIGRDRLIFDPGIGFGKTAAHNLRLLRSLPRLRRLGPVMVGASRKSFIGAVTGAEVADRLPGSLAAAAWSARHGVELLRVHDVAATRQFLETWAAIDAEGDE